jgi:hypothetical protein
VVIPHSHLLQRNASATLGKRDLLYPSCWYMLAPARLLPVRAGGLRGGTPLGAVATARVLGTVQPWLLSCGKERGASPVRGAPHKLQ